ncbi:zinc ribbon domain-containing protein [Halocatena salina]|uniref:Zinc ribbon domain-containing protein n=1 Tax=Halocatena salina TaxID=2934340 RepID=A0A8U0A1U5_9EURY|nr:zinc ribbon domain-containing protein [Halocatena salina]UPM43125.1 zinc ribbon domain-containing protein [Halocatena salina]
MSEITRIRSVGVYTPALRIESESFADAWGQFDPPGIESKAVPDADEDALTMAAAAGRRALTAAGIDGEAIDWLGFATTTPPLAEGELTPRLASMLGVNERTRTQTFLGSTRAGTRALLAGASFETALVVAADCPHGAPDEQREHAAGAGAAAFVLDPDGGAIVTDHGEYATPYPGTRFRSRGGEHVEEIDIGSYERRAFSETISKAATSVPTEGATAAAVQAPNGKRPYRVTAALDIEPDTISTCATVHELGDTGAASVPLSLAHALTDGDHETVLAASFGSGAGADVFRIEVEVEDAVMSDCAFTGERTLTYPAYLRRRGSVTTSGIDTGAAYVSVPSWERSLPQRHRLVAGQCPDCGDLMFPPEGACSGCGELVAYEPIELWTTGTVETVTNIGRGGAPPEFAEHQARAGAFGVAIVRFEHEGNTVSLPGQLTEEAAVGETVVPVIRHIYTQEGVPRYGVKFTPLTAHR